MKSKDNHFTPPNLIVIGAQKCGTTTLHYYLNQHPEIYTSRIKELNFFNGIHNWEKGIDWYSSNFSSKYKINGESSPQYTFIPQWDNVAKRMYSIIPDAKLIYIVRDPIERIISAYVHRYAAGHEDDNINNAFQHLDNNLYIIRTKYYMQISQFTEYYPLSRISIISSEDLRNKRTETIRDIFNFLDVDDQYYSKKFGNEKHFTTQMRRRNKIGNYLTLLTRKLIGDKIHPDIRWRIERIVHYAFSKSVPKPNMDEKIKDEIRNYLKEDINQFRKLSGKKFKEWTV